MRWKNRILYFLLLVVFCMSFIDQTKEAGEGAIVPGVHPRVFLDSSRLQFIRNKVAQNDPTWVRFETYLNIDGPYSPTGYNLFLGGLAYQALKGIDNVKANGYADKVINGMMAVINEGVSPNEDVNKYYLYNMGLAYDWVYDRLTPQQRTSIIDWIDAVYQNNPNGHERDTKTYALHFLHNYTIEFMLGNAVAGYAIYDENQTLALDMIANAAHRWSVDLVAQIAFIASNGAYPEGDGYGYHSIPNLYRYAKAVETAEGRNVWDDAQWIKNRMTYDMFAFFPTRYLDSDYNGYYRVRVGSGDSSRHNFKGNLVRAGALIYISSRPDAEESKRMQSWLDAIDDKALGYEQSVDDFLWYNPGQAKVPYSSAPLTTFSGQGTNNIALGEVIMRSDWTDSATWIRFVSGDYFLYHQHLEANHFNIFKYEDLATESGAYEGAGGTDHFGNYLKRTIAHNSVLVYAPGKDNEWFHSPSGWEVQGANDGGQRGIDIVDADGTILESLSWSTTGYNHGDYPALGNERFYDRADITKFEDTAQYTYVLGSAAKAYSGWRCDLFDREFAFLRSAASGGSDYIVIYDRVNAGDPAYLKYWMMHSMTLPEVSGTETPVGTGISDFDGDTVLITNGNGRLFLKNLLPPGRKITRIGGLAEGKDSWVFGANYPSDNHDRPYGTYRIQIQPALQQNYDAFLNVLYPASSTTASMPLTTRIETATNNMVGTLISDPSMNYVAMFSTDPAGASVTGPVTYALNPTANVRHFLFNMAPNTAYDVSITSEGSNITVTPGSGKYLSSGQGVLTFQAGQETPGAPGVLSVTPADGFSSSGNSRGPFGPSSKAYTLQNTGGSSIDWTASKTQTWVTLSSSGGTLASGDSTTVTITINSVANSLSPGLYTDTVTFTNTTNDSGNATRSVSLTVNTLRCDFNSDGKTDILWRNKTTGQNIVWLMNGTTYSSYAELLQVSDANWQIMGAGDFNGDGKTDVLWRNTSTGQNVVWLMNGVNYGGYAWLLEVADLNWQIVGTGDFNGDGKTDILWRNKSTGQNVIWFMNGTAFSSYSWIDTVADTNWEIVGTGDFNGDGKVDILWRNKSTGQNVVWFMNGAAFSSYLWIDTVPDTNWEIVGTGDFNGDGKVDILWRNKSTGQNIVWLMNGVALSSYVELMQVTDTNWKIVGPR